MIPWRSGLDLRLVRDRKDVPALPPPRPIDPSLTTLEKPVSGCIWVIYTPLCSGTRNPANDGDLRWGLKWQTKLYIQGGGETKPNIFGTCGSVYPRLCIFGTRRGQKIDGAAFVKFK